jgi:excisionase family DNA binding protein
MSVSSELRKSLTRALTPGLLTLDQVAEILGVSRNWVRDHATRRNPRIPVIRLGTKRALLRFRQQDVEAFITAHLSVQTEGV